MIEVVSFVKVIKPMKHSLYQDPEVGAGVADLVLVVRDDDESAVGPLDHELFAALLGEAVIPHGHHLVDEVAVELNGHGDGKSQLSHHPGGIGPHRFPEVASQLGEVLDEGDLVLDRLAVDTADELEVIESGQLSLKSSPECQRPGETHPANDRPARRGLPSTDQSDEGGLARSVASQEADLLPALDPKGDPVEDRALASTNGILLCDFPKLNHPCANSSVIGLGVALDRSHLEKPEKNQNCTDKILVGEVVIWGELVTEITSTETL